MHLPFKPGIGAGVEPLNAHLLQLTVDRLNRMTIRAQFDSVHQPGVQTHGRPAHERMGAAALRPDPSRPGCSPHQRRGCGKREGRK